MNVGHPFPQWASIGNRPFSGARGAWGARSRPPISNELTRLDLPGGAKRVVARARGVHATLVGGRIVHREGLPTGALPGAVLRSTTT